MMQPCFPHAYRRAFLRFEKQVYRALADLGESLSEACFLEYAVRAEADAELADLFDQDGPHGDRTPPHRSPFSPPYGPFASATDPLGVDTAGPFPGDCGACHKAPRRGAPYAGCTGCKHRV